MAFWFVSKGSSRARVKGDTFKAARERAAQIGFADPDSIVLDDGATTMQGKKPTPAQLAARKRFAEMARAGVFAKAKKRAKNPAKKRAAPRKNPASKRAAPRKNPATSRRAPAPRNLLPWRVEPQDGKGAVGHAPTQADAKRIAQAYADYYGKAFAVIKRGQ